MDTLTAMQVFSRVAELTSFTQAAISLGLPRATVSIAVQQLEAEMGTRLLQRTTRRVHLTQDGQVFWLKCQDLLADLDEIRGMFRDSAAPLSGKLRVDMPSVEAREVVLPQLPAFLAEHPALEIELSSTDRRVDVVQEGFDCVMRVGALADSSLIARPLGYYRMVNCASPAYLARYGMPTDLEALRQHQLIHYATQLGSRDLGFEYQDQDGRQHFLPMRGVLTVNNADAYQAACLAGMGIIQVPESGVAHLLTPGLLVPILPQCRAASMPVSLVYPHRRNLSWRVQVFMGWLEKLMQPKLQPTP